MVLGSFVRLRTCTFFSFAWILGGKFHHEVWARNTVLFRGPGPKVCQLATFRAERTPRIAVPGAWLAAEGAGHAAILPS
jgi:hypothetical protein